MESSQLTVHYTWKIIKRGGGAYMEQQTNMHALCSEQFTCCYGYKLVAIVTVSAKIRLWVILPYKVIEWPKIVRTGCLVFASRLVLPALVQVESGHLLHH